MTEVGVTGPARVEGGAFLRWNGVPCVRAVVCTVERIGKVSELCGCNRKLLKVK